MNHEDVLAVSKQMITDYLIKNGIEKPEELGINLVEMSTNTTTIKCWFGINKSDDEMFEIIIDLVKNKGYLNVYKVEYEKSLEFDLTINNKKENEENE